MSGFKSCSPIREEAVSCTLYTTSILAFSLQDWFICYHESYYHMVHPVINIIVNINNDSKYIGLLSKYFLIHLYPYSLNLLYLLKNVQKSYILFLVKIRLFQPQSACESRILCFWGYTRYQNKAFLNLFQTTPDDDSTIWIKHRFVPAGNNLRKINI